MKFGQMMEVHHSGLYVTPRHEEWLASNPNPKYSQEALSFAQEALAGAVDRDRTRSFSASAGGSCGRAEQFAYMGLPQKPTSAHLANIFHTGNFIHLKWQMAGLTAGWLREAEPFYVHAGLPLKGSLDGLLEAKGGGLEVKSINSNGFRTVLQYGPKKLHLAQIDRYFVLNPGLTWFSMIYENKDTGDYKEVVVEREDERVEKARERIIELADKTHAKQYFEVLDKCWTTPDRACFYAPICHDQGSEIRI